MKALNTMKYVSAAAEQLAEYERGIKNAETYDVARRIANRMLGYIECMNTFTNVMIDKENNDFTADLEDTLIEWQSRVYGAMGIKAIDTNQNSALIIKLLEARDDLR